MSFVKLDCGILNSTLWLDREGRDVFITALLMAEPRELREAMPQLQTRTLSETGWTVPAGWYGFVPAAGIGIIRRSGLEQEPGMCALERLGEPEADSRSSEHDGRRLVRVNGGYVVLNFVRYRERDATGAERTRRWRERKKPVTRHKASRDGSRREKREAEEEQKQTNSPGDSGGTDAGRFVKCFNAVFSRRIKLSPGLREKFEARVGTYASDDLVALPILVAARELPDDLRKALQPDWLLRNGERGYTKDGVRHEGKAWIEDALQGADRVKLWPRHVAVAREVGCLDALLAMGATMVAVDERGNA